MLAASVIQLKVLDHIVIGNNRYFSFADQGLIEDYESLVKSYKKGLLMNGSGKKV